MEKKPKLNNFGIKLNLNNINKLTKAIKNDEELKTQIEEAKKEREIRHILEQENGIQQTQKKQTKYYNGI